MTPLSSSPYSYHFLALRLMGAWLYYKDGKRDKTSVKLNAFVVYRLMGTLLAFSGFISLLFDFVAVVGDMKKMTWNLCVTALAVGMIVKDLEMMHRREIINELRLMLHRDEESRTTPEHIAINKMALKEMKALRVAFYGAAIIFIPTWAATRFNDRELPIPAALPGFIDLENPIHFHFVFCFLCMAATVGMMVTMELELAMFSLLVQISREYKILLTDISQINGLYCSEEDKGEECLGWRRKVASDGEEAKSKMEVNPFLKMIQTRMMLKEFCKRQQALIGYTEAFEKSFNRPVLQQFFGMSILIIVLALQLLWESVDFTANFLYQIGYLYINITDMFLMCWYSTRIRSQCLDVGETFYSTFWYRMSPKVQKDISMMIMRSQKPPKITTGKFMELSLHTYLTTMSNIYSWLALFRQLE